MRRKIIRITLITFGSLFVLMIAAALIAPTFLKEPAEKAINDAVKESVNAQVNGIKAENLSISFFTHFPKVTASVKDVSVVNNAPFAGDTLASIDKLEIEVNLWDLIAGDYTVKGITLQKPRIFIKVLADGSANYDIAITDSTAVEEEIAEEDTSSFDLKTTIDHWAISDGHVVYNDATMDFDMEIHGLEHSGSGNFSLDEFDINTSTTIHDMILAYGGTKYLGGQSMGIDLNTHIKYTADLLSVTIKENALKLSNMAMHAEGSYDMHASGEQEMDISFAATETGFKDLLSLVPSSMMTGFESIKADGSFEFDGKVIGKLTETSIPGFGLNLKVNNGMFQYPDLPSAVSNINVDMAIDALDGNLDDMEVDIKKFDLRLGNAPVNGRVKLKGPLASRDNIYTNADVSAKIKLEEFANIFPMDGYEFKGDFAFNCKADGAYESTGKIPNIDLLLELSDGYVVAPDAPYPVEQINVITKVTSTTGNTEDLDVLVEKASFVMHEEPFEANGHTHGLTNLAWAFNVKGGIDLGIVSKYYQDPAMTLKGKIYADIHTKGDLEKLFAEKYDQLPTSGSAEVKDFAYGSTDYFPKDIQTVDIAYAKADFTPKSIIIKECKGKTGKSDFTATGTISNYLGFTFQGTPLKGNIVANSNYFDIAQWMSYEYEEAPPIEDGNTASAEPAELNMVDYAVPDYLDFTTTAKIKKANYSGVTMSNVDGNVILKDGVALLKLLKFNTMGGDFVMGGSYDTKNPDVPAFVADMKIANLSFQTVYTTINSIQALSPAAKDISGLIGTDFKIKGIIGKDLMPIYNNLTGNMLLDINNAAIKNNPALKELANQIGNKKFANPTLDDVKAIAKIENGTVSIKPMDFKLAGYNTNLAGNVDLSQNMDLRVKMKIPTIDLGDRGKAYERATGEKFVELNIPIKGNAATIKPAQIITQTLSSVLTDAGGKAINKAVNDGLKGLFGGSNDDDQKAEDLAKEKAKKAEEEAKEKAKKAAEEAKKKAEEDVKDKAKGLLKKKGIGG